MKSRKKVRYVFLDYDKFLLDFEFINMKPAERGIYCTLILHLYSKGGYLELNETVYKMCNCTKKQFENAWKTIGAKFSRKGNKIFHKKVLKELAIARSRSQMLSEKGLKGANMRWNKNARAKPGQCTGIANEKRSELNENEKRKRIEKNENGPRQDSSEGNDSQSDNEDFSISPDSTNSLNSHSNSVRAERLRRDVQYYGMKFMERLDLLLHARTRSDKTGFRNVCRYLCDECMEGRFDIRIFDRAIELAKEAKNGRNPNALFMSLARKELGYKKQKYPKGELP